MSELGSCLRDLLGSLLRGLLLLGVAVRCCLLEAHHRVNEMHRAVLLRIETRVLLHALVWLTC